MCSSSNSSSSFIHLFSNPSTASLITISAVTQNGSNEDNGNDYNNQKGSIMINEVMIITLYLSFCLMFLSFILALYEGYNCTFLKPFLPTMRQQFPPTIAFSSNININSNISNHDQKNIDFKESIP